MRSVQARRAFAAAAFIAALLVPAVGATGSSPITTGISPGSSLLTMSPGAADGALAGMSRAGAKYVRLDVPWFAVQPSKTSWQWGVTDRLVKNANRRHLKVLAILSYAPNWALTLTGQPDPNAFATFAGAAASRYKGLGVTAWEIWNEENMNWAWPVVSPGAYGELLKAAYRSIHAKQSNATVLFGGLGRAPDALMMSQSPDSFMSQVLANGYKAYFDAVSFHPYTYPDWPDEAAKPSEPAYQNGMVDMANVQKLVAKYGRGSAKVWATEFGAPTSHDNNAVSPQVQAQMITRAYKKFSTFSWAGPFFVFNWQDDSSQGFGLLDTSGKGKPALGAFKSISIH